MGRLADWWNGTGPVGVPSLPGIQYGILSPYQDHGPLGSIVYSDVFGVGVAPVSRGDALSVPAVSKARGVLISLIADKPLKAYRGATELPTAEQPTFLYRTNVPGIGPFQRMLYTLDDLIFHGGSLWGVERGASGTILHAWHISKARWETDDKGRILVDKVVQDASDVIYFPAPSDGLLAIGGRTLKGAAAVERAWVGRAMNPIPAMELHQTNADSEMTEAEAKQYVKDWAAARTSEHGAIGFTPYDVELRVHGVGDAELLDKGRNAIRIDVANFFNLPASILDGSMSTASLTYSTAEGKRNEVLDYSLPYWIRPIEARLSMDDVVPQGQRIAFDFASLTGTPQTGNAPTTED